MAHATIESRKHATARSASGTRVRRRPLSRRKKTPIAFGEVTASLFPRPPKTKAVRVSIIRGLFGVSQDELSRITGYSVRAIASWEAGTKLSQAARQKLVETDRLRTALTEIVPPAELGMWMRTPNPAFEGQSPIQVIERGEIDRIWRMIIQIDSGVAN
ncbi:MAG: DUF2384 domain-containing protein [Planctomycetes bacterium]|nr:DUF2384 domain-containing protein [Planctomycetota bacterium]